MKKMLPFLLALMLLGLGRAAFAAGTVSLDGAVITNIYGSAVTPDGNTVIAASLRDKENRTEGQNPAAAWLTCIGSDGQILWEKKIEKPDSQCIYASPCVFDNGSVIALYIERTTKSDGKKVHNVLQSFSPKGESTGELTLDDTYVDCLPMKNGMLVSYLDRSKPMPYPRHCTLYSAQLQPIWSLDGITTSFSYDASVRDGDIMTLLCRYSRISENIDQVRLIHVGGKGNVLWTHTLAEQQMGYMGLQMDMKGNCIVILTSLKPEGGQSAAGSLICIDPEGNELWNRPVTLPEEGGMFQLSDFRLLEDGYLLMGLAKTETRVRLYRIAADGTLIGTKDHYVHEEMEYRTPRFAELGGELYACTEECEGSRTTAMMMPLTIPRKE